MRRRHLCLHRQRHPHVRRLSDRRAEKLFGSDADDGVCRLVNRDGFADRRRVAAQPAFPPCVAHDRDRMRALSLVIGFSESRVRGWRLLPSTEK